MPGLGNQVVAKRVHFQSFCLGSVPPSVSTTHYPKRSVVRARKPLATRSNIYMGASPPMEHKPVIEVHVAVQKLSGISHSYNFLLFLGDVD